MPATASRRGHDTTKTPDLRPLFRRVAANIVEVIDHELLLRSQWMDLVEWIGRDKNKVAEHLMNYTMHVGRSWSAGEVWPSPESNLVDFSF